MVLCWEMASGKQLVNTGSLQQKVVGTQPTAVAAGLLLTDDHRCGSSETSPVVRKYKELSHAASFSNPYS